MAVPDKKTKIILVDDDDFLVDMYSAKFSHMNVDVVPINSGTLLLEKLRKGETADIILLDIVLPQMDGIETLKQIRKEKLAEEIPIIMLTNQNDENDIKRTRDLGVDSYVVKAFTTPSEVVDIVLKKIKSK